MCPSFPNRDGEIDYANGDVLRYADDIIITTRSYEEAERASTPVGLGGLTSFVDAQRRQV